MRKFTLLSALLAVTLLFSACDPKKSNNGTEEPTPPKEKLVKSILGDVSGEQYNIDFTYDADNQLTAVDLSSAYINLLANYTYGEGVITGDLSLQMGKNTQTATIIYSLDSQGRISRGDVSQGSLGTNQSLEYGYNSNNQLISVTYGLTDVTSFEWTGNNCTSATRGPYSTKIIYSNDINRNPLNLSLIFIADDVFSFINANGSEMLSSLNPSRLGAMLNYNIPTEIISYVDGVESYREPFVYTLDSEGNLKTVSAGGTDYTISY